MFKDWKTTIAGIFGAVAAAVYPVLESGQTDSTSLATAAAIGILGIFSGDSKET